MEYKRVIADRPKKCLDTSLEGKDASRPHAKDRKKCVLRLRKPANV